MQHLVKFKCYFSLQAQYLKLECHFSLLAQHLVKFKVYFSRQAQYLVKFQSDFLWQVQHFVNV